MTKVIILLLLLCISSVFAHDWMISPVPRGVAGASAQTVEPCEAVAANAPITPVFQGKGLTVEWANGHKTGDHSFGIAKYGQDTTIAQFTNVATVPASQTQAPQFYGLPASAFSSYPLGTMLTLRYSWTSFDNCATIRVAAVPPTGALLPNATSVNPITNKTLVAGDYLVKSGSKAVGVYNAYSDTTTCSTGFVVKNKLCVPTSSSDTKNCTGMSTGGKAALAVFLIALFAITAFAAFSYDKTGHVLGYVKKEYNKKNPTDRALGDYVAFTEKA